MRHGIDGNFFNEISRICQEVYGDDGRFLARAIQQAGLKYPDYWFHYLSEEARNVPDNHPFKKVFGRLTHFAIHKSAR